MTNDLAERMYQAIKFALARYGCRCDTSVCDWCKYGMLSLSEDQVEALRKVKKEYENAGKDISVV